MARIRHTEDYQIYATAPRMAHTAGVDEAGRGPLAGAVWAAAVILDPQQVLPGLMDSKKLTANKRELLVPQIKQQALAYGVGTASAAEIDQLNILQASLLAMQRALAALPVAPRWAWFDGLDVPLQMPYPCYALVKGDAKLAAISAASILAKVARDEEMLQYAEQYPEYGFAGHKGYPTAQHLQALREHGPCPIHRRSYAPVARCLQAEEAP